MKSISNYISQSFAALVMMLLATSCGENNDDATIPSDAMSGGVSWPELTAFEELSRNVGRLAKIEDRDGILGQRTALLEMGWAVSPMTMPENASDPDRVHQLLGDLTSLVNGLARSEMSDERLFAIVEGLHPVTEKLIEASGMSHPPAN